MFFKKSNIWVAVSFITMLILAGCAGQKQVTTVEEPVEELVQVSLTVDKENLRDAPNGTKVGEAIKGESLGLMERRGNWCQVKHAKEGEVWIWAPSLGYASVNPMNVRNWVGGASEPATEKSIIDVFGRPTSVEMIGSHVAVYHYNNYNKEGKTLFGTHQLKEVLVYVDRLTRTVSEAKIILPPFKGNTKEAIPALGLPSVKSSGIDFERARYINKFAGITLLELNFLRGDFEKIESVNVYRNSPQMWRRKLDISDKKVTIVDGKLALQMTLKNNDTNLAYACPSAEVELYQETQYLGKFQVGPADVRVNPGTTVVAIMPIPVEENRVEVKKVAARADITSIYILPGGK